jgi:prephenate dehydratase
MATNNSRMMGETSIGYLGPQGTFSEETVLSWYCGMSEQFIPYGSIDAVIRAVEAGEVTVGIVPVENSLEGSVNITLDMLAHEVELFIVGERVQSVHHNLLVKRETQDIKVVMSHPQALAQCRNYLKQHYPAAEIFPMESTAAAAHKVATGGGESLAAVGSMRAAELYGLRTLAKDIQDNRENATRFVTLAKQAFPIAEKECKTSIVCQINGEKPGSLYEILGEFASRQVNLTKIESRPARTGMGMYIFFLDIAGGNDSQEVQAAIRAVRSKCQWFKNLGTYPAYNLGHYDRRQKNG